MASNSNHNSNNNSRQTNNNVSNRLTSGAGGRPNSSANRQSTTANKRPILTGGYDANFDPVLDKKYVCPVCLAGLQKPVQTKCGHRFCKSCVKQLAGTRSFTKCPVDKTWIDVKGDVFEDIAVEREVLSLRVKCGNHNKGCEWTGELRELQVHSDGCLYSTMICPNGCEEMYLRQESDSHLKDCPLRLVDCPHCEEKIPHKDIARHRLLMCPRFPINCAVCGRTKILREEVPKHLDVKDGDCPNVIIPCSFERVGCRAKVRRCDVSLHNQESTMQHLEILMAEVGSQQSLIQNQEKTLKESQDMYTRLRGDQTELIRQIAEKDDQIKEQSEKINQLENTSYNGRLHWKVKISEGNQASGRNQCILSPPFYTGSPGYKLRACLELKGHKSGDVYFSSISIVLCQGKFDDKLHFPFSSNCTVSLFDQSTNQKGRSNFVTSFDCNNMSRVETDGNESQKRGRLRFMKTDTLIKGRFCVGGFLYMQVDMQMSPPTMVSNSNSQH